MENLLRCTVRGWTDRDVADSQLQNNQQTETEAWQPVRARVQNGSQRGRIDMPMKVDGQRVVIEFTHIGAGA